MSNPAPVTMWKRGCVSPAKGKDVHNKQKKLVLAYARMRSMDALKALVGIMRNDELNAAARVKAAEVLLNRAWGKPTESVEISGMPEGGLFQVHVSLHNGANDINGLAQASIIDVGTLEIKHNDVAALGAGRDENYYSREVGTGTPNPVIESGAQQLGTPEEKGQQPALTGKAAAASDSPQSLLATPQISATTPRTLLKTPHISPPPHPPLAPSQISLLAEAPHISQPALPPRYPTQEAVTRPSEQGTPLKSKRHRKQTF
jgi:hypothetical protein